MTFSLKFLFITRRAPLPLDGGGVSARSALTEGVRALKVKETPPEAHLENSAGLTPSVTRAA